MTFAELEDRIARRTATVGVVGLGYVGLPLVILLHRAGFRVVGFDTDNSKVERLRAGESYIGHIPQSVIQELVASGRFEPTVDFSRFGSCDTVSICVPTPLTRQREPDLSFVESTGRSLTSFLRAGQLVVLESTTYPGTTREVLLPILESDGLAGGCDFLLAYSPEREDPGNPRFSTSNIPKVVGGLDEASLNAACALYRTVASEVVPVESLEVAEACKILENTYRAVNIALVNELKILFDRMGISMWDVIAAAKTKPFGFQPFYPGPGLGGHCIPIDPFYLTWLARRFGLNTRFIELAGEVNTGMPHYVVDVAMRALNDRGRSVRGSRIGILGVAYKKNVDDPRESPAFEILQELAALGAELSYHDPYIARLPRGRKNQLEIDSQPLDAKWLQSLDCLIVVTDHSEIDWQFVKDQARLIIDPRNACGATQGPHDHVIN